jgi:DNA-binding response OmpR family regulator
MQNNNDNNIASKPTRYRIILIVDDEPDITSSLKMGLEYNGFEVHTFNDPVEALSNLRLVHMTWYSLILKCQK